VRSSFIAFALAACTLSAQTPERVIALEGETHHVQGIVFTGEKFLVTSVERAAGRGWLMEFDGEGRRLRAVEIQSGQMIHPGGFDVDESSVWIPVAEYRAKSRSRIERRSLETLELISSFEVPDHVGALALASDRMFLANWDSRQFYEYSLDGKLIRVRDNPAAFRIQDLKFRQGALVGSSPAEKGAKAGSIVWLDPETLMPLMEWKLGRTDRGVSFTQEGLEVKDGKVYLLPEDAPSRVFVFDSMVF
jgi:hypothetical protein